MGNRSYYVSKSRKKKETRILELDHIEGYKVNPKIKEKDAIEVTKIIFVNPEFAEKIIRKKIDRKIDYLLGKLKLIEEDDSGVDNGTVQKTLEDAEKLRLQIINNYVKYLGHTYESLTLEKIKLIVDRLKYNLYVNMVMKENYHEDEKEEQREGKRGR